MRTTRLRTKLDFMLYLALGIFATSPAHAWWWSHPDRAVRIEANSGSNADHTANSAATISGKIHYVDAITGEDKSVPKNFNQELEVHFYYPSKAHELTNIKLESDQTFSYPTPPLVRGDLNVFSVVVGKLTKKTHKLQHKEAVTKTKLHALKWRLKWLSRQSTKNAKTIASINKEIAKLTTLLESLQSEIEDSLETIASYDLPILLEEGPSEASHSMSIANGFRFKTSFDSSGIVFAGDSVSVTSTITDLSDKLPKEYCDRDDHGPKKDQKSLWMASYLWNKNEIANSTAKTLKPGESIDFNQTLMSVKQSDLNVFEATLSKISAKDLRKTTFGDFSMPLVVVPPFQGQKPVAIQNDALPTSFTLTAAKTFSPLKSFDDVYNLPLTASILIPATVPALLGSDDALGVVQIQFDERITCSYKGDGAATYNFDSCKRLSDGSVVADYVAGNAIRTYKYVKAHLEYSSAPSPIFTQATFDIQEWDVYSGASPAIATTQNLNLQLVLSANNEQGISQVYYLSGPVNLTLPQTIPVLTGIAVGSTLSIQLDNSYICNYALDFSGSKYVFQTCDSLTASNKYFVPSLFESDAYADQTPVPGSPTVVLNSYVINVTTSTPVAIPVIIDVPITTTPAAPTTQAAAPVFQISSPAPNFGYAQALPDLSATLTGTSIPLSTSAIHVTVTGTDSTGAAVNQDITTSTSIHCSGLFSCTITGSNLLEGAEGSYTLTLTAADSNGNAALPISVSGQLDHTSPVLTSTFSGYLPTANTTFDLPISVSDLSPTVTTVALNGVVIAQSSVQSFTTPITLVQASQTLTVSSVDAAGNVANTLTFRRPVINNLPPLLRLVSPLNLPISPPLPNGATVLFVGSSNKPLATATINGKPATISADGLTFSAQLTVTGTPAVQFFPITFSVLDTSGVRASQTFTEAVDVIPPTLTVGINDGYITSNASLTFPVTVQDKYLMTLVVKQNGVQILSTTVLSTNLPLSRPVPVTLAPGVNTFQFTVTSQGGNTRSISLQNIVLDQIAPQLSNLLPNSGTVLSTLTFTVSGQSSKSLAYAKVNGQSISLASDKKSFSGPYTAMSDGALVLHFEAADLAGNVVKQDNLVEVSSSSIQKNPPAIAIGTTDNQTLKVSNFSFPVTVVASPNDPATATVYQNGQKIFTTTDSSFTVQAQLYPGTNLFEVRAKSQSNLTAIPAALSNIIFMPQIASGNAPPGTSLISPTSAQPDKLSSALVSKLSTTTSLLALAQNRSDTFSCQQPITVTPPQSSSVGSGFNTDLFAAVTPEIAAFAQRLASIDAVFFFVRDQIKFLPRFGATQTALQTLRSGTGTAADKASLLIALLRALGVQAQYLAGDVLVPETTLLNLYDVGGTYDLAWAQIATLKGYFGIQATSGYDPAQMVYYEQGKRAWQVPHVWVYANLPVGAGANQWLQIDPTYVQHDYAANKGAIYGLSVSFYSQLFFGVDAQNNYVKPGNILDLEFYLAQLQGQGTSPNGDYSQFAPVDEGITVGENLSIIPSGTMALATPAPCVKFQADSLSADYQFTSLVWAGNNSQTVLQATLPTAQTRLETLSLSHSNGLLSDAASGSGLLQLKVGDSVLASGTIIAGTPISLYHAIQEPKLYGAQSESRTTPGALAGGVQIISHSIGPVTQDEVLTDIKNVIALSHSSVTKQKLLTALLRLVTTRTLVSAAVNDSEIEILHGVSHQSENLLVLNSTSGALIAQPGTPLGVAPSDAVMDWDISGPIYQRSRNYPEISAYQQVTAAKGEGVVAGSSVEGQVWEELFGTDAVSTVKALQLVAFANANGLKQNPPLPAIDLIQGNQLTTTSAPTILARMKTGMQPYVPFIQNFIGESPNLYSVTDITTTASGWSGVAFAILPSTPLGSAGVYIASSPAAILLGSNSGSTNTCSASYNVLTNHACSQQSWSTSSSSNGSFYYSESFVDYACRQLYCDKLGYYCNTVYTPPNYIYSGCALYPTQQSSYSYSCNAYECTLTNCTSIPRPANGIACTTWSSTSGEPFPGISIPSGTSTPIFNPTYTSPASAPISGTNSLGTIIGQTQDGIPENAKMSPGSCANGQPVNVTSGAMWHKLTDFIIPGRTKDTALIFDRTYLSQPSVQDGDFGPNWRHSWEVRLYSQPATAPKKVLVFVDEGGGAWSFTNATGGDVYQSPVTFQGSLQAYNDHYALTKPGGIVYNFYRGDTSIPDGYIKNITEPHGEAITFTYDSNKKLQSVSTGLAGTVIITRNGSGKIASIKRQRDNLTYTFTYDSNGKLASSSDFDHNTTTYGYNQGQIGTNAAGLLTSITDPLNRQITFTYYDNGQSFEQSEPGNGYRFYEYSAPSSTTKYTRTKDLDGNVTEFRYDSHGRVLETVYPDLSRTSNTWNTRSMLIKNTDEIGVSTSYIYTPANLPQFIQPAGQYTIGYIYDSVFNKVNSISANGTATYLYQIDSKTGDAMSLTRKDPSNTVVFTPLTFSYDSFGNVLSTNNGVATYANQTDPNGLYTFIYDSRNPETRTYDSHGRVATRRFKSGRNLSYSYDNHDRIMRSDDSTGRSLINTYDAVGRLLTQTQTDGSTSQTTSYEWDVRDRLTSVTDAIGRTTKFTYDKVAFGCNVVDKPASMTDAAGRVTRYQYDLRQRLIREINPLGEVTRYEYNPRGDRTAVTDASGNRTTFTYDNLGRVSSSTRPTLVPSGNSEVSANQTTRYAYDAAGRLIQEYKASALTNVPTYRTDYTYDLLGHLISKRQSAQLGGSSLQVQDISTYTYSPQIDATLMTSANNTVANLSFQHEATPPFALTGYSMQAADATNPLGLIQDSYSVTRDITGEIGQINSSAQGNLLTATYDPAARLTKLVAALNHRSLTTTLVYDSFGRKRGAVSSSGLIGSFSYDLLNRFTSIYWNGSDGLSNQNFAENLNYEALTGNISQVTRENSVGTFNFTYDNLNQLVTTNFGGAANLPSNIVNRSFQYDPTGNRVSDSLNGQAAFLSNQITADARFTYVSDADGMGNIVKKINNQTLASEVMSYRADGKMTNYQSSSLSAQYYFDALGRRVAKKITPNAQASFTQCYSYIGEQDKILIAKAGDGTQTLYVDGQGVNEHFGEVGSRAKAYVTDHLGSMINGSAAGSAQSFGAHGEMLSNAPSISSTSNPVVYGWQGLKHDSESGLEDNWHRGYDSITGRFLQVDPTGFAGGSTNLYESRFNNPLIYTDPDGRNPLAVIAAVVAGAGIVKVISDVAHYFQVQSQLKDLDKAESILEPARPGDFQGDLDRRLIGLEILKERARLNASQSSIFPTFENPPIGCSRER